jgi:hypothetical protein
MSRYTGVKVNISEAQQDKIKKSLQAGTGVSIKLAHNDLNGDHDLYFTQAQVNKLTKAYHNGTGVTIKMSKTQLENNKKVQGGFIGAILPFLATAARFLLPSLATGAMAGLGSAATSKIVDKISGSGVMYVKKGDMACKVRSAGSGLYLSPWQKGGSITAEGLYMKTGQGYVKDGKGLLLGPNSPFANIPILGMIL